LNGICSCGMPDCCCQLAVAGGVIYANLWGELNSHLALQALFTQSSHVREPLLQAFPFPSTLGEVTLYLLPLACMFVYSSHGKWVFPPLLWSFPPTTTFTSFHAPDYWAMLLLLPAAMFTALTWELRLPPSPVEFSSLCHSHKLSHSWLLGAHPLLPLEPLQPAWLVYLQFQEGFPSPNLQCSVHPTLFPTCLCCSYCLLLSFSFFSQGGGRSVQGTMLLWPRVICGSTTVPLSSPCPCLPKPSGHRRQADWGTS
jgi:hypothetical protein